MHRTSPADSLLSNSIDNRLSAQEVSMYGSSVSTSSQSSLPSHLPVARGGRVLVSMRAEDAPSFLASLRPLLPEGAVVVGLESETSDRAETGREGLRPALTERQRDVLRLLVEGLSNKEIARRLALSHFTVRNHVSQILRSFDFSTRRQAEAWGRASVCVD